MYEQFSVTFLFAKNLQITAIQMTAHALFHQFYSNLKSFKMVGF